MVYYRLNLFKCIEKDKNSKIMIKPDHNIDFSLFKIHINN